MWNHQSEHKKFTALIKTSSYNLNNIPVCCLHTGYQTLPSSTRSDGLPAHIPNCAASGHLGHAPHRHPGEGKMHSALMNYVVSFLTVVSFSYVVSFSLQSWWVWTDSEIRDLWYNCFHNNATETWMCASTNESGKVFVCTLSYKHVVHLFPGYILHVCMIGYFITA